jgi:hypothetical protein
LFVDEYVTSAVFNNLRFDTAADSLADCRDFNREGTAIVAMMRMMATTINNSKSEKPRLVFIEPSVIRLE